VSVLDDLRAAERRVAERLKELEPAVAEYRELETVARRLGIDEARLSDAAPAERESSRVVLLPNADPRQRTRRRRGSESRVLRMLAGLVRVGARSRCSSSCVRARGSPSASLVSSSASTRPGCTALSGASTSAGPCVRRAATCSPWVSDAGSAPARRVSGSSAGGEAGGPDRPVGSYPWPGSLLGRPPVFGRGTSSWRCRVGRSARACAPRRSGSQSTRSPVAVGGRATFRPPRWVIGPLRRR
jgi:hypothetical protein